MADTRGKSIRRLRKAANISLVQLAIHVNLSFPYIAKIERGERPLTEKLYLRLRLALVELAEKHLQAASKPVQLKLGADE